MDLSIILAYRFLSEDAIGARNEHSGLYHGYITPHNYLL